MRAAAFLVSAALIFGTILPLATGKAEENQRAAFSGSLAARLAEAAQDEWIGIIVNFDSWDTKDPAALERTGALVVYELYSIPTVFAWAKAADLADLARMPGIDLIEHNDPITYDLETAHQATNVTPLWPTGQITLNGTMIDGKGVTVAVVDTGVNAQHDDIAYRSRTVRNVMAVGIPASPPGNGDPFTSMGPLRWEDTDNSDGGGHGSHVAGIVAGDGKLSGGRIKGSAPGASLVGLGSQLGSFWYAVAAWDWVFQNHKNVNPPVRIITNSWGYATGQPCNQEISLTKVQKRLVLEAHIVMFFSAGNTGTAATGAADSTRTQFKCPWEGNIGVANYNDNNTGTRDGKMATSTSKGKKSDPTTWPDISAPGSGILATRGEPPTSTQSFLLNCRVLGAAQQGTTGCYTTKSGTSMSTPYAAGVAALLLQVRPDLKPADVEYILEQTAYKLANPDDAKDDYHVDPEGDYRHHGSHYVRGHGLIDAARAVQFALNYDGTKAPVVYGEKEGPHQKVGFARARAAKASPAADATPGFEGALLIAAVAILVLAWRRP